MRHDLRGKSGLVTGAGSGIGRAVALKVAECGARVLVCDKGIENGQRVVDEIRENGGVAEALQVDVCKEDEVQRMIDQVIALWGQLDLAVNAAGVHGSQFGMQAKRVAEWSEEVFDTVTAVNLRGIWLSMKYQILRMKSQGGGGAILNIASIGGFVGIRGSSGYVASKHGVIGLTRAAALEYAGDNIRLNSVCPGVIETPLGATALAGRTDGMFDGLPAKRLGQPEEVAALCIQLLSDRSAYITGGDYLVDGGYIAA